MYGSPKAGGPAKGVGGGAHILVDADLDEVRIGDVCDHVIPVICVVSSPVQSSHFGPNTYKC